MASAAVGRAMNLADQQNIHPFFTKSNRQPSPAQENVHELAAHSDAPLQDENQADLEEPSKKPRGRGRPPTSKVRNGKRKSDEDQDQPKVKQASIAAFAGLKKDVDTAKNPSGATSLEEDPNFDRRKRQKTATPEPEEPAQNSLKKRGETVDQDDKTVEEGQQPTWLEQLETEADKEQEMSPEMIEVEASSPTDRGQQAACADLEVVLDTSLRPAEVTHDSRNTSVPPSSPPIIESTPSRPQRTPRKKGASVPSSPSKPSPPKKMLRLNASGRFSSPVSKHPNEELVNPSNERKTRSRGNKKGPKQLIVKIPYIKDDERAVQMAEDIDEILAGIKRVSKPEKHVASEPGVPAKSSKSAGPPKPTHPFFTGKASRKDTDDANTRTDHHVAPSATTKPPPRRGTAITPGKLRAQVRGIENTSEIPSFGMMGTKPRRNLGGLDAPWPWKGITRVEDDEGSEMTSGTSPEADAPESPFQYRRKFKSVQYGIPDSEAILPLVTHELQISSSWQDETYANSEDLMRFPKRLLTTGPTIQRRVQSEIRTLKSSLTTSKTSGEDRSTSDEHQAHPVLIDLFNSISNTLTAFDRGECESLPWVQKYSPKHAADMLGSSMEISALRKWLEALKVNAVGGGTKEFGMKSKKNGIGRPAKKKRKKEDLDDFIVSVDDGLDELTDPDDKSRPSSSHGGLKSMIRFGGDVDNLGSGRKLHNLVLLSGPHGSGKTAAVFAVAKELEFEVFEINPSSRRSGKDVLDKIGDMTENHLVQRQTREQSEQATVDSDAERLSNAFKKDIESGRQKSMSSFFRPAVPPTAKPKASTKQNLEPKVAKEKVQPTLGKPKQTQKQSLILLEEVDVLFEDDKNFWQTVEHLAIHSRRPIIMTCTDESLVRLNEASLHAILRMTPAPTDLATDYLLLIAAKEGHLLNRKSISDLYESKSRDLRASIMELDFWCQMAVGDRKGGLEWIYQRWPPGKDVDEHGQILRVASEGTYQTGMGWVGHDIVVEDDHVGFDREYELMLELTESWNIEPENYSSGLRHEDQMEIDTSGAGNNLRALQDIERLAELSSAADVYCRVGLPTRDQPIMDPTQPPLPEKARANYIDGYAFLQADPLTDFTNLDTHLAVSSHLTARRCALAATTSSFTHDLTPTLPTLDEPGIATTILSHLSPTHINTHPRPLTRADFFVLDPLAEPPQSAAAAAISGASSSSMTASSFDRTFAILVEDLAPYVRSIAAFDLRLEQERMRSTGGLVSAGGGGGSGAKPKRARMTRAARSAVEGGRREDCYVRKERWFDCGLNLVGVMRTAGRGWSGMGSRTVVVREGLGKEGEGGASASASDAEVGV